MNEEPDKKIAKNNHYVPKMEKVIDAKLHAHHNRDNAENPNGLSSEIPEFDLEKELMARHRNSVAQRRRKPHKADSDESAAQEEDRTTNNHRFVETAIKPFPKTDRVIREIVARDIRQFCEERV